MTHRGPFQPLVSCDSCDSLQLCSFWQSASHFLSPPALCGWEPCGENSKVNRVEQKRFGEAFHWGNGGLVLEARCPQLDPISAPSSPFRTQEGFKPFQYKLGVIAGGELGFLWILAQIRLLFTSQGKCTNSLIYTSTFCWGFMNTFMTQSLSSSICSVYAGPTAQQMCTPMGHTADNKKCGDRSDPLHAFLSLFPFLSVSSS